MRRHRAKGLRGFYSGDSYAAFSLATRSPVGASMADARIHSASETFAFHVVPDIDETGFKVECEDERVRKVISDSLLERSSRSQIWTQPNLSMEMHLWISEMVEQRDVYLQVVFDQVDDAAPWMLSAVVALAPETLVVKGSGAKTQYEQYASVRAFEGTGVGVIDGPRERLVLFRADEILHLRWPLDQLDDGISPEAAARRASRAIDRHAQEMLLNARAGADPRETFLPLARARAGAYADALEKEKLQDAIVSDRLFQPVDEDVTEFFYVDRLVRSRLAVSRVRAYLFSEFNRQVLDRWTGLNGWPPARVLPRRTFWSEAEWLDLHRSYISGTATIEDIVAAAEVEWELRRFSKARLAEVDPKSAE